MLVPRDFDLKRAIKKFAAWIVPSMMKDETMTYPNSFEACLQELRRELGLAEGAQGLEWQGESFYFSPSSAASASHATIYVLVADLAADVSADALKRLFWHQLQSVGPSTPVFGWDPESGQLVIAQTIPLGDMSFAQVITLMSLLANMALQARGALESDVPVRRPAGGVSVAGKSNTARQLPRGWLPFSVRA